MGTGIQRKILVLVLGTGALLLLLVSILSFSGMIRAEQATEGKGEEMLGAFDAFAVNYAETLIHERLNERAQLIAIKVSQQLEILDDAENIAKMAEKMLASPWDYPPQHLTEPHEQTIAANKAYIYYSPGVRERLATDPRLSQRVALLSNIRDTLEYLSYFYTNGASCCLATEDGFFIRADGADKGQTTSVYEEVFLHRKIDIRERPWYVSAKQKQKSAFTDVYKSTNGNMEVSSVMPFFDNDGKFAGIAGVAMTLDSMRGWIKAKENDINFVMGHDGQITISSQESGVLSVKNSFSDLRESPQEDLAEIARKMAEGESGHGVVTVDGTEYYLVFLPVPNMEYSCAVLTNKEAALSPTTAARETVKRISESFSASVAGIFKETLFGMGALFFLVFAALFLISRKVARKFVNPVLELTEGMKKIATGDLDTRLSIKTRDEIEALADSVNAMTVDLKSYIGQAKKSERIEGELDGARKIQEGMLPRIFPAFPDRKEIDLYASMHPAKEVGGDFYDFYMLDNQKLVVTIADVSGKGIPASLFMVISKTILKNCATTMTHEADGKPIDWSRVLGQANAELCENNEEDMFVTVFFGVLDLKSGDFAYVNGGHNPPLICHDGKFEYLRTEKKSTMLGFFESTVYYEYHLTLAPGDVLFLYTDGVTEAMNEDGAMYSEERLRETLNAQGEKTAKELLAAVQKDVSEYAGKAEQSDDITMLGVIFRGEAG